MNVWCHLPTIIRQRRALRFAGLPMLCVALITTLFFGIIFSQSTHAVASVSQTVAFQGRLLNSDGNVVPEGYYNIQFKIYENGSGTAVNNPGGTLKWTETYINNGGTNGIHVKNGYFSVNLGSKTPFGSNVDWTTSSLWLSMNVAGSAADCSSFGSGTCSADGEMLPMKQITATPLALNSEQVGGKTANQLVQLGQGTQTDSSNGSSITINKTGSGNFLSLQSTATDIFSITNSGDIAFGSSSAHSIGIGSAAADLSGVQLTISAGSGGVGDGSSGGELRLVGGDGGGDNGDGGNVTIDSGEKTGTGSGGSVAIGTTNASSISIGASDVAATQTITIGTANTSGSVTNVTIGSTGSASGGSTTVQGKDSVSIATNGTTKATFNSDNSMSLGNGTVSEAPTDFTIQGTDSSSDGVSGGSLTIQGGGATTGNTNGGNLTLGGGSGSGTGADGLVIISTPTFATSSSDANCYTSGALVATDCTVSTTSLNSTSVIMLGFSEAGHTATLPDPTITTAGRIVYITAAGDSSAFTLLINGGGNGNELSLRANSAATLLWNGSDWVSAGSTGATALQDSVLAGSGAQNIQIGNGSADNTVTLLTLDKSASAPTATDNDALLGSIYYDTSLGKIQCYEADGWGDCGSKPDNFVSLSPEYANAVTNGSTNGTLKTDLCSDELNINDGSDEQASICGTNETYNFYSWTSTETTDQQKSIYVNYQLPTTFKKFASDLTSLKARTDSSDASVSYQLYRNKGDGTGLTTCSAAMTASTGAQTTWQTKTADDTNDPADCNFSAGDTLVVKITLSSKNGANAYVSNLNFTYSNE